jgi:hypothetical protein
MMKIIAASGSVGAWASTGPSSDCANIAACRCGTILNNWVANRATPAKYFQAISEIYGESYGDDVYANNPVNYVKLDRLPPRGEWGPIINAMKNGEYFVTSVRF